MKQDINSLLFFLLFSLLFNSVFSQKVNKAVLKKSPELLKEDFVLLQKILEANHPSLYWYTPKDSLDTYFREGIAGITDSLNEVQFKNKLSSVISKIRCGHTSVFFSRAYAKYEKNSRNPSFPLLMKAWEDSLVVLGSLFRQDSIFKPGTIITGINGRSNRQLLDSFFQFISSDGYGYNYKNQTISNNFPGWYKNIIGLDSSYQVTYIDTLGKEVMANIKNFNPIVEATVKEKSSSETTFDKPTRRHIKKAKKLSKQELAIDTSLCTAFFRLSTFSGGGWNRFFRRSFKAIQQQKIKNVVIDLRSNGGGKVTNSILLTQYLTSQSFKIGDSVVAISRKFKYGNYIHPSLIYWFAMNFGAKKMADAKIHFRHYEQKVYEPKSRFHFNGQITLIQGGLTFSAATMFIANLKGQERVTLVGEETGGGYYGNSAMYLPTITLPNSGLRVSLPMFRLVMDPSRPKGRGIMPDIPIPPSSWAIKRGIDPKMQKIRELIQHKTLN